MAKEQGKALVTVEGAECGFLFVRLGKWLIVLPSIDQIHTPDPAVLSLLSPARAGCIQMWLFGKFLLSFIL
jgi:hypothetical protein